ncbi:MAG TPA: hypothetical protein PK760_13870 [Flavobacteriales bacterium]|nr:hypothetical protein [Flavobacteriales bacterium]
MQRSLLLGMALCSAAWAWGQAGVATLGLQVKPVLALDYFDPTTTLKTDHLLYRTALTGGLAFGMSVRVGITKSISLETGLGSIRRNYDFSFYNDTSGYEETGRIRYAGYELPITGLVYIRLGQKTWMNTAMGLSLDFYPSDAEALVKEGSIYIFRKSWMQAGALGNLGFEYRSLKSGTWYIGATYHRPFNEMALADLTWNYFGPPAAHAYTQRMKLNGSYLTLDLRYYFHEDPMRRGEREEMRRKHREQREKKKKKRKPPVKK